MARREDKMMHSGSALRLSLTDNKPVIATFVMVPRVEVVEMLAVAGYDGVILDLEHGPIGVPELTDLAAFAKAANIHSIARISELSASLISAVLDAGVDGVMVPHVASAERASAAVRAARFPPEGNRSLNPYVRGASYNATTPESLTLFGDHAAVIGMVEGKGALDQLDEILATQGLDGLFVGPVDLSGDLGYPGQPEHPEVVEAIKVILNRCRETGVASGVFAPTPARANQWLELGASLVAVSADAAMMLGAFQNARAGIDAKRLESKPKPAR